MKVLVTGAAGFLGRAVVERLLASGQRDIRCVVRPGNDLSALRALKSRYPSANLEFLVGSLVSPDVARLAVNGIEVVYHLAAGTHGFPATVFLDTVVASRQLLQALHGGERIVLVSSIGVYDVAGLAANSLVDETRAIEPSPEKRNAYFHAKIWQENLFREQADQVDLTIVRPGILYGRGSRVLPARVGLRIGRTLLKLGRNNLLPLSHVVNCAEAIVIAGESSRASGQSYNVVDDDLPLVGDYVRAYQSQVENIRALYVPFSVTMLMSKLVYRYHVHSHGQIPRILSPHQSEFLWKGHRFSNRKIKALGWKQIVPTGQAMNETFFYVPLSPPWTNKTALPQTNEVNSRSRAAARS